MFRGLLASPEFTAKDTGEVVQLDYRWAYVPEGATVEEGIFEGEPEVVEATKEKAKKLVLQRA